MASGYFETPLDLNNLILSKSSLHILLKQLLCINRIDAFPISYANKKNLYSEGIKYASKLFSESGTYTENNVRIFLEYDPALIKPLSKNIFGEKDAVFPIKFTRAFRFDKWWMNLSEDKSNLVLCASVFWLDDVYSGVCLKCIKIHLKYSDKPLPNKIRKDIFATTSISESVGQLPSIWCSICRQVPLFRLLTNEKFKVEYGDLEKEVIPNFLMPSPRSRFISMEELFKEV